jgi:RHS repeat-associated protein
VKSTAGTEVARYGYDGLNRRIVEQVGTAVAPAAATAAIRDVYFSQDWQALEERVRTSTGAIPATADTRYIWSPVYIDAMVARDRNADGNSTTGTGGLEQRVYALQDANWNTTAIIAATGLPGVTAGNVINRFVYTPYGESQMLTASWTTPAAGSTPATPWAHLFQGLKFTDVTGLAYVRHRDYSATLGRFIEMDPIGFDAGDNNWYRFVANGPTGKVDPRGLWTMDHRPYVVDDGGAAAGNCCPDTQGKRPNSTLDSIQLGLDLLGLVPVIGEAFDGLNGLISLGRGDLTGAGLSFAGMVPVGGQAATAGKLTLKYGDEVAAAAGRCAAPVRTGLESLANLRKLKDSRLKELGVNAEELKKSIVGNSGGTFNVAVGDNGKIFLIPVKKGAGPPIPTEYNLDKLPNFFPRGRRQ